MNSDTASGAFASGSVASQYSTSAFRYISTTEPFSDILTCIAEKATDTTKTNNGGCHLI